MKITIFYSWQSTTDAKYNKNFISDCIKEAIKKIRQIPDFSSVDFEFQDAVRGEAGQVAVADTIIQKRIPNCDIFIADLSVVNSINKFQKFIMKIANYKYKPVQNNNVMIEYGTALNSIGKQKIITVLNAKFGSPKDDPANIPFDIKHDRFPIEYNYCSDNENQKAEIKKKLVSDLIYALQQTIQNLLVTQKSKFRPFIAWNEWNEELKNPQTEYFIKNDKIQEIKTIILDAVKNSNNPNSIRLLGLSGLGKTRILFEIFRPQENDNNSLLLSNRVLYINSNNIDSFTIISKIKTEKSDAILVIDNCSKQVHRDVAEILNNSAIKLITINSTPEEFEEDKIKNVSYIIIKKDELTDVVEKIVDRDFSALERDYIEKIKQFSQGIPLMAVLLGESVKKGEKFIGKLEDKDLLDKLLGEKGKYGTDWRKILQSCSIFNCFGFEKNLEEQYKFIAKNKYITSINGDDEVIEQTFYEVCQHYIKREIFETNGRYLSLRPTPLAMALTEEWLSNCNAQRLSNVINNINGLKEPHNNILTNSFADRMKDLGYNEKAKEIIERIVGVRSPFDNAEVLNTELGSRLFRSFVEVNPVAVSQNFSRQFSNKTTEELLKIDAGRRNIVWTLEKLCFDKNTFIESTKILYSFAVAENETWGNNATGQFLQLFHVFLAGTEADLKTRWAVIEWGLNKNDDKFHGLALKAMKSGLETGHFHRMGGAEKQGTKQLADYSPATYEEIYEYWGSILTKLTEIITQHNEYSDFASDVIADSIRGFYFNGHSPFIIPYLSKIIAVKNNDWDKGLENLKMTLLFDKKTMSEENIETVQKLIDLLTKTDFISRFYASTQYEVNYIKWSSEKFREREINRMEDLAKEFIEANISWENTLPVLYKKEDGRKYLMYKANFGAKVYEYIKSDINKINLFIDKSLDILIKMNKKDIDFYILAGFIEKVEQNTKDRFYSLLYKSEQINYLLFSFVSFDKNGAKLFYKLFDLIDSQKCELADFLLFRYGMVLQNLNKEEIELLKEKLFSYGDEGYAIFFELLSSTYKEDYDELLFILKLQKECILFLKFNHIKSKIIDYYKYSQCIISILNNNNENEFAKFIINSIISSISWENNYHLDHYIQEICEALVKKHFKAIWADLSKSLIGENEDLVKYLGLKNIFGSYIGGIDRSVSILLEGDIEEIFKWCRNNKPLAPIRIAGLLPIFTQQEKLSYDNIIQQNSIGKRFIDDIQWNPITKKFIDEFGDIQEMLNELNRNMYNFSWSGSIIPLYQAKKKLFESISNHSILQVSEWAKQNIQYAEKEIENKKITESEMFLY